MSNQIYIPSINPIQLVVQNLSTNAKYNTHYFENALFSHTIPSFQQPKIYNQKWQNNDTLYFQLVSTYGPVSCKLIDCFGKQIVAGSVQIINTNYYQLPSVAYGCTINFNNVPEGVYQIQVLIGTGTSILSLISNTIEAADIFDNTALIEFSNSINDFGCIFQNGEVFNIRVEAIVKDFQPGSNDVVYEDEPANLVRLSASPFRSYKLTIGTAQGVPNYIADIINRLLACDNVLIDGKAFTKADGAKLERNGDPLSPMAGWTVDIRETKAKRGITIINDVSVNNNIAVVYDLDNTYFGNLINNPNTIIVKTD